MLEQTSGPFQGFAGIGQAGSGHITLFYRSAETWLNITSHTIHTRLHLRRMLQFAQEPPSDAQVEGGRWQDIDSYLVFP